MSDFKSKLPDLKELGSMTSKLFKDVKQSVDEIINDYKKKRESTEPVDDVKKTDSQPETKSTETTSKKPSTKTTKEKTPPESTTLKPDAVKPVVEDVPPKETAVSSDKNETKNDSKE